MAIRKASTFSLKDRLFNRERVRELRRALKSAAPGFPGAAFERKVLARFPELELKERIAWIVTVLETCLPARFEDAREILTRALPEPLDPDKTDDDFGEFIWVVPGEYVAKHGCTEEHVNASLGFLRESTKRFSAENAIRPFLRDFPEQTMAFVRECARDRNYHVRRLASEGIRPLLPWAPRVTLPLDQIVEVLDRLHRDPTRYVTRSVANNLNDLSKLDADLALDTAERWLGAGEEQDEELAWVTRHALRTLLREDHGRALTLLGYEPKPAFRLTGIEASDRVRVGDELVWRSTLVSLADQRLRIALRIHFLKADGSHSSKKFAMHDGDLAKGERIELEKRQPFVPRTTRPLYPGRHYAEVVVNGRARGRRAFELARPASRRRGLDQRDQIRRGLDSDHGESRLLLVQAPLGVEQREQRGLPDFVPDPLQIACPGGCRHRLFPARQCVEVTPVASQSALGVGQGLEHRGLPGQSCGFGSRFGDTDLRSHAAPVEDPPREGGQQGPRGARRAQQIADVLSLKAASSSDRQAGIELGRGDADVRGRSLKPPLRRPQIRPPREKIGPLAHRKRRHLESRRSLLEQPELGLRQAAGQGRQSEGRRPQLGSQLRPLCFERPQVRTHPRQLERRRVAHFDPQPYEIGALLHRFDRRLHGCQATLHATQREIGARDFGGDPEPSGQLLFSGAVEEGLRCFQAAPRAAEEVRLPGGIETDVEEGEIALEVGDAVDRQETIAAQALLVDRGTERRVGKLPPRDPVARRAGLGDPRRRLAHAQVLL